MDWSSRGAWVGSIALLVVLAVAGVASLIVLPPIPVPTSTAVAPPFQFTTEDPSPTNTPHEVVDPVVEYSGSATCESLMPDSLMATLSAFQVNSDYREEAMGLPSGVQRFAVRASHACAIGESGAAVTWYMYGPVDNAYILADALLGKGYISQPYRGCTEYEPDRALFLSLSSDSEAEENRYIDSLEIVAICEKFWVVTGGDDDGLLDNMISIGKAEYGQP